MGIGNLKIENSRLYVDVIDPLRRETPLIDVELPEEIADEIFERFQEMIDSLPEPDEVARAFKRNKQRYLDSLREQVNYD